MVILIDVDNIIGNLCDAVLSVYNEDSGDNLCSENITSYYIENFVKPQYKDNFKHYFLDKRVSKRMKYVEGCREYIAKHFNVQLICLSDINKSDVINCFECVIKLVIKSQNLSNFEIMTHEGNEKIEHGYYKVMNGQMSFIW